MTIPSLFFLRVVLKSGSTTELAFDKAFSARAARSALKREEVVSDDYGHELDPLLFDEIAALVFVDFDEELKLKRIAQAAQMLVGHEAQQDATRAAQKRPSINLAVPNGQIITT